MHYLVCITASFSVEISCPLGAYSDQCIILFMSFRIEMSYWRRLSDNVNAVMIQPCSCNYIFHRGPLSSQACMESMMNPGNRFPLPPMYFPHHLGHQFAPAAAAAAGLPFKGQWSCVRIQQCIVIRNQSNEMFCYFLCKMWIQWLVSDTCVLYRVTIIELYEKQTWLL